MANGPTKRGKGRPPGEFGAALSGASPEHLAYLRNIAKGINGELNEPAGKYLPQFQRQGGPMANEQRSIQRNAGLERVAIALREPILARMSDSSAAVHLATEMKLSPHTLRKYIAQIRKLTGPTS